MMNVYLECIHQDWKYLSISNHMAYFLAHLSQIMKKSIFCSKSHVYDQIFTKLSVNVYLNEMLPVKSWISSKPDPMGSITRSQGHILRKFGLLTLQKSNF